LFFHGRCPACREKNGRVHRANIGTRALSEGKDAGTVEREGQTFRVVTMPAKRKRGRRRN